MNERNADFFWGLALGAIIAMALFIIIDVASAPLGSKVICEHYGGEMKADVCIVDNKVFDIE